jgi:hypothetical protein
LVVEMPRNQQRNMLESISMVAGPIAASDKGLLRPTTEVSIRDRMGSLVKLGGKGGIICERCVRDVFGRQLEGL